MPASKYIDGKCDSCKSEKRVTAHIGKMVCSSCMSFRIGCKNTPELVIAGLREFGNLPDEDSVFQPELNDYVTLTQYESMRGGLNQKIDDLTRDLNKQIADAKWFKHSHTALEKVDAKVEDQVKEIEELNIVIETLKESIRAYQSEENARLPEQSMSWPQSGLVPDTDVVEQIAWRLAEGTIAGTIIGVSLDDIRSLRSLV